MNEVKHITNFELRLKKVPVVGETLSCGKTIDHYQDCAIVARDLIGDKIQEHFIVFLLDFNKRVLGYQMVAVGKQEMVEIDLRILFRAAIQVGASYLICAHNHPTGYTQPSSMDVYTTNILQVAGDILGIVLLDHIIVSSTQETSLASLGLIKNNIERDKMLRKIFNPVKG
jgi:DNA repair protein RadC